MEHGVRSANGANRSFAILAVVAVALVAAAGLHEIGHDEAQAWNIARASRFPWDVVAHGRVEGHTPFWHVILWAPALTGNPVLMQLVGVILAIAAAALLLRDRPFPLAVCVLIAFGYYPFYQYGLVPRPYTLALFLAALIGSAFRRGAGSFAMRAFLCGLLAFTSAFGLATSLSLMSLAVAEAWPGERPRAKFAWRRLGVGTTIYVTLAVASAYTILFPLASTELESTIASGGRIGARSFLHVIESAAFPQYDRLPLGIGGFLGDTPSGRVLVGVAAYGVTIAVAVYLWCRPAAVLAWLISVAGVGYAGLYSGFVAERYAGHLFLAALALCWARDGLRSDSVVAEGFFRGSSGRSPAPDAAVRRCARLGLLGVLAFHVVIGSAATALDALHEQSPWRRIAADLAGRDEASYGIVATYGYDVGALSAYLDRPVYDLRCDCWTRHTDWSAAKSIDSDSFGPRICALQRDHGPLVTVVTRKTWTPQPNEGFREIATYQPGYRDPSDHPVRLYVRGNPASACPVTDP